MRLKEVVYLIRALLLLFAISVLVFGGEPTKEANQIASTIVEQVTQKSVELIPTFREYCETSAKVYLYQRHLHYLAKHLTKKKLLEKEGRNYVVPGRRGTYKSREFLDAERKFIQTLMILGEPDSERSDKTKPYWACGPFDAYGSRSDFSGIDYESELSQKHATLIVEATKLRDAGAKDLRPVINECGESIDMEEMRKHAYELCVNLHRELIVVPNQAIPQAPIPTRLVEVTGITHLILRDYYHIGDRVVRIPSKYLPLFQQTEIGPNKIGLSGHFRFAGNVMEGGILGASSMAELYECDVTYCEALLKHKTIKNELRQSLPDHLLDGFTLDNSTISFGRLVQDLTRYLNDDQIKEVQTIINDTLPEEAAFTYIIKTGPVRSQGIFRVVEREIDNPGPDKRSNFLIIDQNCQLFYKSPGRNSELYLEVRPITKPARLQLEQDGVLKFDDAIEESRHIRIMFNEGTVQITVLNAKLFLWGKFIEGPREFGRISVPPSRAIFRQDYSRDLIHVRSVER